MSFADLSNFFDNDNSAIVDLMVENLPNGHEWENYNNKLSKNVKNRGLPTFSKEHSDESFVLVQQASEDIDTLLINEFRVELSVEGRMGGHWCIIKPSHNGSSDNFAVAESLFDVLLTPEGRVAVEQGEDYFYKNGDDIQTLKRLIVLHPKQSFLEFDTEWEETITNFENIKESEYFGEEEELFAGLA